MKTMLLPACGSPLPRNRNGNPFFWFRSFGFSFEYGGKVTTGRMRPCCRQIVAQLSHWSAWVGSNRWQEQVAPSPPNFFSAKFSASL